MNGHPCGFGRPGCVMGFHDCDVDTSSGEHEGRHHCRQCGEAFD